MTARTFRSVVRKEGTAALIATHNLELTARTDRALVLQDGKLVDGEKPSPTGHK
jgi:lipoprotein-releasing system ATP-binding protein